ncbi:MAG: hypothetical protein LBU51_07765 [Bacteroidales bacterium]|jgi:acyl-ACP thioesterase|nr:hypothetical protein [Bacteroidales bacterium]
MDNNNVFEQEFTVLSYLSDCNSKLAPHYLLLMMQEVAWGHVEKHHIGWSYLAEKNQFWALIRLHVQIERMPEWNETIKLRTWGKNPEGISHFRDHEMVDKDGNIIMCSTSTWVVLDFTNGRPQRLEDYPTYLYTNNQRDAIEEHVPKIKKITMPENGLLYKPVVFSDIDVNQHVNNSKYLQFALDAFPIDYVKTHRLTEFFINFNHQAKEGDDYSVYSQEIAPNNFTSVICLKERNTEVAIISTKWNLIC